MTHDYKRNGTTTLFAALDVATARSSANACRAIAISEFLRFLARSTERRQASRPASDRRQLRHPQDPTR